MTREEAIKILKAIRVYECYPKSASEETKEAIDMAIEALNSVTDSENGEVESKNDVIKRQDAIKTVIRMCSPICDWELREKNYTACVIDEINSLPSADITETETCQRCQDLTDTILNRQGDEIKRLKAKAVQGWIPVSERLPEKDDLVLVTVWNDVSIAWRNIYGGWESAEDMYEKGDVIAWMPLPEPYEGGDSE